jgi:hypothetical protein
LKRLEGERRALRAKTALIREMLAGRADETELMRASLRLGKEGA